MTSALQTWLANLNKANETCVDGVVIKDRTLLKHGSLITIHGRSFLYEDGATVC